MSRFVFALAALSAVSGVAAGDFPVKTPLALPTPTRAALPGIHALAAADPSLQACTTASEVVSYCNDIQPTGSALASCLCCYNGDGLMDPVYSSCENYIVTSLPSDTEDYEVLTTLLSYCSAASAEGFDCGSVASTPTTTGGGGGGAADKAACTSFASVYSSCSDSIDDFTDLPDAEAASCLCYKGGKYTTVFDDYLSSCGVWAKTGDPVDYDTITRLQTFCELFTPTTTVAASETALPPACQSYESIFSSCSNKVAGWSTIDNADAASCLCYKNGKYTTAFDDAVSGCGVWAKTASPDIYTSFVEIQTFCEDYATTPTATFGDSTAKTKTKSKTAATGTSSDVASSSSSGSSDSSDSDSTTSPTTTRSRTTTTVTPTPTVTGNAAPKGPQAALGSGLAAWLAVVLPFVL